MSDFTPKFPCTVAGTDWRSPLEHPELETIARRADHLYRNFSLSEAHRTDMLMRYALLVEADRAISTLGRVVSAITLQDDPGVRPARPVRGNATGGEVRDTAVGFALRFAAWVALLEDAYGVTAWARFGTIEHGGEDAVSVVPRLADGGNNVPRLVRDDDAAPQPGDDI